MDSVIWWPRLATLLPDTFNGRIDAGITPMYALLNLATLSVVGGLMGGVILAVLGDRLDLFLASLLGSFALARLCYYAALGAASGYGSLVRVAFDLYRAEILKQMRIELAPDRTHERALWQYLGLRLYAF